jgi:diguanylate cyclase (GGDEF)-like protein
MLTYHQQLQSHALTDLTNRAKSGILTYICVWMILAYTYKIDAISPTFLYLNTGILILLCISRLAHLLSLRRSKEPNIAKLNHWLVLTVLAAALHWGGMSAWIIYDSNLNTMLTAILIITPAFTVGGACTLSISSEIRTLYPMFMLLPMIGVLIHNGSTESLMYALLCSICLTYIFTSSKSSHNDYWSAITNHLVAEERAELMEQLSTTDPLTQLKNRMYFDKEFGKEWKRCSRMSCSLSLIMIDLDYFKNLNDNFGHVFGDECLRKTAQAIKSEVARPSDCVARYGGEEFIVLLPNTNRKGAENIAKRMLRAVSALEFEADGQTVSITCSIGGSTITPDFRREKDDLLKDADTSLYYAKEHGRNQYYASETLQV